MARTWAIQEDSVNTSIIHWYSTERMREDTTLGPTDVARPVEVDLIWEALADSLIMLTMSKLLNLVPGFRQAMEIRLQTPHKAI